MNQKSVEVFIPGPAGRLEGRYYKNEKEKSPIAIVLQPHPQYSGTMNNYFSFYGIIDKMIDSNNSLKPFSNNFIDKKEIIFLFDKLFSYLFKYKYWLISYNNKSYPDKSMMLSLLKKYAGKVDIYERKFNYQLSGSKNKNTNREYLFYCQDIYNNGTLNLGL